MKSIIEQRKNNKNQNQKNQPPKKKEVTVKRRNQTVMQPNIDKMDNYGNQLSNIMSKGYGNTLAMYPGTLNFAKVYTDPFLTETARVPVFPIVSSSLEKYYATGKGHCNASGNGWIAVIPLMFASNATSYNVSTTLTGDPINSPGFAFGSSSSPHALSAYYTDDGTYAVRVVSIGIRVRYIGSTLNAAGTCLTCQASPLGDGVSGLNYTTIKQLPGFKEYTFRDTSWHSVTRHIEAQQDTFFAEYDLATSRWVFPNSTAHPYDENLRIGVYMACEPNQAFEYEISAHYELTGTNLVRRGVTTPDTAGFEHVVGTMSERRQRDNTTKDHNVGGTWSTLTGFLKNAAKSVIPLVPSLLSKLLI